MLATMSPRPRKPIAPKDNGYVDVFSRMDAKTVEKLDALADDQHRSRSGMVAWVVEQYIAAEGAKLKPKPGK